MSPSTLILLPVKITLPQNYEDRWTIDCSKRFDLGVQFICLNVPFVAKNSGNKSHGTVADFPFKMMEIRADENHRW